MIGELIYIAASLVGLGEGEVSVNRDQAIALVESNISAHLEEIKESYNAKYQASWEPTALLSCVEVVDEDDSLIGYKVSFDEGSISFRTDGSLLSEQKEDCTYKTGNYSGLTDIGVLSSQSGFALSSCLAPIYSLSNALPSFSWGNYSTISINDVSPNGCVQMATMDLLYTYKCSGVENLCRGMDISTMRTSLESLQSYSSISGTTKQNAISGLTSYLASEGKAVVTSIGYNGSKPTMGFFSPIVSNESGHCAMIFGKATTNAYWNFKTEWSIVMSDGNNYSGGNTPTGRKSNCDLGIFAIDNQYKNGEISLTLSGC